LERLSIGFGKRLAISLVGVGDLRAAALAAIPTTIVDVRNITVIVRPISVTVVIGTVTIIEPKVGARREDAGPDERRTVPPKRIVIGIRPEDERERVA